MLTAALASTGLGVSLKNSSAGGRGRPASSFDCGLSRSSGSTFLAGPNGCALPDFAADLEAAFGGDRPMAVLVLRALGRLSSAVEEDSSPGRGVSTGVAEGVGSLAPSCMLI